MKTAMFGRHEAGGLFSSTGYEKPYWAAVHGSRVLSRISSRVRLPDRIEIPTDRPVIIAANHSSLFDLIAALVALGNYGISARIGVNARFFANPASSTFLRGIGCIPFRRGDDGAGEDAMVEALLLGQSAAMMPEGRISRPEDQVNGVGPARPGISRIARRAKAAVLPVGFAFANETWTPGTRLPRPRLGRHEVVAKIGPPLYFTTDDHRANADQLMRTVGDLVVAGRHSRR